MAAVKKVHQRFVDDESGKSYYYNSLTRQVTWNAPKLLGKLGRELSVADGIADETTEEKKSAEPVLEKRRRSIAHKWTTEEAALCIQGMYRKKKARENLMAAVKKVHQRFVDDESGKSYYYNSLTRQVTWNAPKLLGKLGRELSVADGIADETTEEKKSAEPVLEKRRRSIAHKWTTEEAALCIQGMYRKKKARENLMAAVKKVHQRFVDDESGKSYYYNSLTRQVTWNAPKLLGKLGRELSVADGIADETTEEKSRLSQSWRSDDDPSRTSGLQRKQRKLSGSFSQKESA